jgi:hypothetical protein
MQFDASSPDDIIMGTVIQVDTHGRQNTATVLFAKGLTSRIWVNHLEVLDERQ